MLTIPFFTKPNQTNWEKYAFMTLGRQKLCKLCKLCKFQLSFSKLSTFRFSIFSRNFGVFFVFWKIFGRKVLVTTIFDCVIICYHYVLDPKWTQNWIILNHFCGWSQSRFILEPCVTSSSKVIQSKKFGPKMDPNWIILNHYKNGKNGKNWWSWWIRKKLLVTTQNNIFWI